jgi:hypothetical protein
VLLDRQNILAAQTGAHFTALGWLVETLTGDVFDRLEHASTLEQPKGQLFDAIVANLFLHHFTEQQLIRMFRAMSQQTSLVVATEPQRSIPALFLSKCLGLIGCNYVTRHDAVNSVRAGFAHDELSRLWPATEKWKVRERAAGFCAHLFVAEKIESTSPTAQSAPVPGRSNAELLQSIQIMAASKLNRSCCARGPSHSQSYVRT